MTNHSSARQFSVTEPYFYISDTADNPHIILNTKEKPYLILNTLTDLRSMVQFLTRKTQTYSHQNQNFSWQLRMGSHHTFSINFTHKGANKKHVGTFYTGIILDIYLRNAVRHILKHYTYTSLEAELNAYP